MMVGSLNQDPRSRLHNTEAWIAIDSVDIATDLAALFDEGADLQHAFKVEHSSSGGPEALAWTTEEDEITTRYDTEPMAGAWLRIWRGVLGALIPEHLL